MKKILKIVLVNLLLFSAIYGQAQTECKVFKEGVMMREGKMCMIDKAGIFSPMEEDKEFSGGVKVSKTGDYKNAAGQKTKLKNGELISSKGELFLSSELIVLMEGATLLNGQAGILSAGGLFTPIESQANFGNGLTCTSSGLVTLKDGSTVQVHEGEIVALSGELIRKRESVFPFDGVGMRDGKLVKLEQGRLIVVSTETSLGTSGIKVSPNGTVKSKEGASFVLSEGSMITSKGELAFSKENLITDGVFKRAGKMYLLKNVKVSPLNEIYILSNGNKVDLEGFLLFSETEKMELREGELVLPSGELMLYSSGKLASDMIQERTMSDHYIFRSGKMMLVKNGEPQVLMQDLTLPNGSKLLKHGHVVKKDGVKHILKEGEKLALDGTFIVDKSKMEYDENNHFVMKQAKVYQVKEGKESALLAEYLMPDWSKIYPDGTVEKQSGLKSKMKEGDRFSMEGEVLSKLTAAKLATASNTSPTPAPTATSGNQNYITMKGAKLLVVMGVKEILMGKEREMTNGTKVALNGTVLRKNGSSFKMQEGDKIDYNSGEPIK